MLAKNDNITMEFSTSHLVDVLKKNREQHAQDLEDAKANYTKAYDAVLSKNIKNLQEHQKDRKKPMRYFQYPSEPHGFLSRYDRMISMLVATTDHKLALSSEQYQCYALDEWPEKAAFENLTGTFSSYYET